MPLDLPDLLACTATVARAARERAALPHATVTRQEEDAVLERLPVVVRETLEENPDATTAPLLQMRNAHERALAARVAARLAEAGVEVREELAEGRGERTPCALHVSIPSVLVAAERFALASALASLAPAWQAIGGASTTADHHAGTLTLTALPAGRHVVAPGWGARPSADVVEEARAALGLPRWPLAAAAAAWRARAGAAATLTLESGLWTGGRFTPASALIGLGGAGGGALERAAAVTAGPSAAAWLPLSGPAGVALLSVEALVARAAEALGLAPLAALPSKRSLSHRAAPP